MLKAVFNLPRENPHINRQINGPPKMFTHEYARLCGKKDSADVIKIKDLEMGQLSWVYMWAM